MTVDGKYTEKWTKSGTFSLLSSTKVFIGGSNQPYKLPGANTKTNFVGCMKKVCFSLPALPLALYPWWVVFFVSWWADLANLLLLPFQSMRANQGLFSWWWHVLFVCLVVLSALLQNLQRQAINAITRDNYWLELWTCNLALREVQFRCCNPSKWLMPFMLSLLGRVQGWQSPPSTVEAGQRRQ